MHNNFILEPAESLCSFPARSVMCEGRVDPGVGCVCSHRTRNTGAIPDVQNTRSNRA